jgi:predicted RNA binding protein YcfA (HicA-like mRNA interferase family)
LSSFSSRDVLRALINAGFEVHSQRGSHLKLRGDWGGAERTVIVPHPKHDIPDGTFSSILRQAGMTRDEFRRLV